VRVELRRAPHDKDPAWYLDTGASNHMTGVAGVFAELDKSVSGKVRFGDGSVVDIHGCSTILFAVDDERHRQLDGVYWIPRLKSNIVSIGQLDEIGYPTHVEDGYMTVHDRSKNLIAEVPRTRKRLYVTILNIVQPVCLSVCQLTPMTMPGGGMHASSTKALRGWRSCPRRGWCAASHR
jgi:hypothetical protein